MKELQWKYNDSLKEIVGDDKIEQSYQLSKNEFERLHAVVQDLADSLDNPIPTFEIEEDKSKQT